MVTRHRILRLLAVSAALTMIAAGCAAPDPVTGDNAASGSTSEPPSTADATTVPPDDTDSTAPSGETTAPAGTGDEGTIDGAIPIGLLLPFTGEYSWVGSNVQPVVEMVLEEEVNQDPAFEGGVSLVQGDTEGLVDTGATAARKLATADQVVAFIGPTSLSFTGVRQVIEDTGTVMVSPTAGTTELDTAGTERFFRTVPSDSLGGQAIAAAVANADYLGRESAFEQPALMVGEAPALVSFAEPIVAGLAANGLEPTTNLAFAVGKQSYRSEIATVLDTNPDVIILVAAPEDSAQIMREAFEAGYEGSWFLTQDQTNADYIDLAGAELVEDVHGLVEAPFGDAESRVEDFTDRLVAFAGTEPDIFSLNSYDAINVLTLAMLQLKLDGQEVTREALPAAIKEVAGPGDGDTTVTSYTEGSEALQTGEGIDYQGLVGPVDFDDHGNITAPFAIQQVQSGEWVTVATIPAEDLGGS